MEKDTIRHLIREAASSKSKTLDLSYSNLHEIPAEVFRISGLKRLLLNNNRLTALPDEFSRLEALEFIDLSNNQIRHLPASLAAVPEPLSRTIIASNNALISIAPELCVLFDSRSHRVVISGNPSLTIPEELPRGSEKRDAAIVPMETQSANHINRVLQQRLDQQEATEEAEKAERTISRDARIQANRVKRIARSEKDRNKSSSKRIDRALKDM